MDSVFRARRMRLVGASLLLVAAVLYACVAGEGRTEAAAPSVARSDLPASLAEITIMIDPGHGGANTGAYSSTDIPEKTYNNALSLEVADSLEKRGFTVVYTRAPWEDVYMAPLERVQKANDLQPDLFLSIHHNKDFYSSKTRGYSVYYSSYRPNLDGEGIYLTVGGRLYEEFVGEETIGGIVHVSYRDWNGKVRNVKKWDAEFYVYDRTPCDVAIRSSAVADHIAAGLKTLGSVRPYVPGGVEEKDFIVLRWTDVPAVMVEAGYISHPEEESVLSDPATMEAMADRIGDSLRDYFLKVLYRRASVSLG